MKALFLFLIFSVSVLYLPAQNIVISFTAKDAGKPVDSTTVSNQNTGQKVKLVQNESLTLTYPTGISFFPGHAAGGYLYPNPGTGEATLVFSTLVKQEVYVKLTDVTGRLISGIRLLPVPGRHQVKVGFPSAGVYTVSVWADGENFAVKATCLGTSRKAGLLEYEGSDPGSRLKNAALGKTLKYSPGDVLLYSAYSGKSNTLMTDSPTAEKTYSVEFPESADPENKTYKVAKIGTQWWFAENLQTTRYKDGTAIPQVANAADWSVLTTGAFAWYNNDAAANRNLYGGYYNWVAVNSGNLCPAGWHVPTDAEWKILDMSIGMTQAMADLNGQRPNGYGTKMKTGSGLDAFGFVFNSSGFSGLLGGYRLADGTFNFAGNGGYWWCASEASGTTGWCRALFTSPITGRFDLNKTIGMNVRCVRD